MKISVIIPVYNVEKYIEKCILSVLNQKVDDMEVIIINDGTTDNSILKIEKYLSDKRIRLINKKNGGLSSARNEGLKIATGEYIYFIDSDDWMGDGVLNLLYDNSENSDIVFSNFTFYNEITSEYKKNKFKFLKNDFITLGSYCLYNNEEIMVWNKLYKRSFLEKNNLNFIEKIIFEDEDFGFRSLILAKKVKYIEDYKFYYRVGREKSITATVNSEKAIYSLKKIEDSFQKLLESDIKLNNFQKIRIIIRKFIIMVQRKKFKTEEIIEKELNIKELLNWKLNLEERILLQRDIEKLLSYKTAKEINLLNWYYLKKRIISTKALKKILKYKLKNGE